MKEKLSLEEFVNLREEDGDATLNFLNEEIEIDWEEDGMEIEGNTLNFSSKLDFLMIEGADNLIPIRSGQKILLSTNNWKRPMPTKRMKMEKDETSFYLGKSKFGEDIFIILSKVNVGKEEFEMKECSYNFSQLEHYKPDFSRFKEYPADGDKCLESKDTDDKDESVITRKSKIKAVPDDVALKIHRALIKTMSDDPEISSTSGGCSRRHWRVGIERYKKLGHRTLYISNFFADNLVPNIQEELGEGTKVKFVCIQFGQNMLLRNGARSMSHLFKYYELAFANRVTIAIARDMCQVNLRNTILSKKRIIEYAMANDGTGEEGDDMENEKFLEDELEQYQSFDDEIGDEMGVWERDYDEMVFADSKESLSSKSPKVKKDKGYFYPKLFSNGYGNYSVTGRTSLNATLKEKLTERYARCIEIKHQHGYMLASRLFRKTANEEPFHNKVFSRTARDPTVLNGKSSKDRQLIKEIINETDIKALESGFSSGHGKSIGFRIESIFEFDLTKLKRREKSIQAVTEQIVTPILETLDENINGESVFGRDLNEIFTVLPSSLYCRYGYAVLRTLYEGLLKLMSPAFNEKARLEIGNVYLIELMEDLMFFGLNGNSVKLPVKFMKENSIFIKDGFIRIPKRIVDFESMKVCITEFAIDFNNDRLVSPHGFIAKVKNEFYLECLEYACQSYAIGDREGCIISILQCLSEEVRSVISSKFRYCKWEKEKQKWVDQYPLEENPLSVGCLKIFVEIGNASKDNMFLDDQVFTIESFCETVILEELNMLPYSNLIKTHLLEWFGKEAFMEMKNFMKKRDDLKFYFWFPRNEVSWHNIRPMKTPRQPMQKIKEAIMNSVNMEQVNANIDHEDNLDKDDWYQMEQDRTIIPFQLKRLYPEAYPDFLIQLKKICSRHPEYAELVGKFDHSNEMDQYVLIWCLKTMIRRSFPHRYPCSKLEKLRVLKIWNADNSISKERFAGCLLLCYLALKNGSQAIVNEITKGKHRRWKITESYLVELGVAMIKEDGLTLRSCLSLNGSTKLMVIRKAYDQKNEKLMKEVLQY